MTYYLGITLGYPAVNGGHDAAACLVKDDEIVAFVEEERLNRFKHAYSCLPVRAINYCLRAENLSIGDVQLVVNTDPAAVQKRAGLNPRRYIAANLYRKTVADSLQSIFGEFDKSTNVSYVDHHIAHTYSAFPLSGFDDTMTFTIDGVGDWASTLISRAAGDKFTKVAEFGDNTSLGYFYSRFTHILGFEENEGEGKVMGLSSYGQPSFDLQEFIDFNGGKFSADIGYDKVRRVIGQRRLGEIEDVHKNLAASVQKRLEDVLIKMIEHYNPGNLSFAGGVALNCVANGKMLYSGKINDIFIQPIASDAGTALGAAIHQAMLDGHKFGKMRHTYYGPSYGDEEIENLLMRCNIPFEKVSNVEQLAAESIAQGKIIAWFQGRVEAGPRALGNRSILADPTDPEMKDKVNNRVKFRESWRPFCPSILNKYRAEYFDIDHESPYMILAFNVLQNRQKDVPSIVHVDGTARPQTVEQDVNPRYHKLIECFQKEKGVPVLLNTSFNIKGEPMVCSPIDALRTFYGSGLDMLMMNDFVIQKSI